MLSCDILSDSNVPYHSNVPYTRRWEVMPESGIKWLEIANFLTRVFFDMSPQIWTHEPNLQILQD